MARVIRVGSDDIRFGAAKVLVRRTVACVYQNATQWCIAGRDLRRVTTLGPLSARHPPNRIVIDSYAMSPSRAATPMLCSAARLLNTSSPPRRRSGPPHPRLCWAGNGQLTRHGCGSVARRYPWDCSMSLVSFENMGSGVRQAAGGLSRMPWRA